MNNGMTMNPNTVKNIKNKLERLISIKQEIEKLEDEQNAILGSEICYKGDYGCIALVDFQKQYIILLLENEDGEPRRTAISFNNFLFAKVIVNKKE